MELEGWELARAGNWRGLGTGEDWELARTGNWRGLETGKHTNWQAHQLASTPTGKHTNWQHTNWQHTNYHHFKKEEMKNHNMDHYIQSAPLLRLLPSRWQC
ncbi:hypothetical protein Pmani_039955 [Petrolisthes manimaculis]|uniref:Uncharacterized protein n=1 Tax=Petrolisthes manimaculis TaxID=1843537 RepID=A0AAE1NBQ8_9EUCA|nr:hypothetical protein Pmani_039955 [Petrolisthes manimaculis]